MDDIQLDFLAEGLDDYVGLWQWVGRVRRRSPDLESEDVRAEVLRLVGELLKRDHVRAGQLAAEVASASGI